jgi:prepilin-type N-terminal cleavage/methylation domain-containing protein
MKRRSHPSGYTLIELLIVVAIIGVLAAVAVLGYLDVQKKAKVSEATSNLGAIWKMQENYHMEYGTYARPSGELSAGQYDGTVGWHDLGFFPLGTTRYGYEVLQADDDSFLARARGNIDRDAANDVWMIDEIGALRHAEID